MFIQKLNKHKFNDGRVGVKSVDREENSKALHMPCSNVNGVNG